MSKVCDHTSVGILVWKSDTLLLIERARFPFGYAVPAGHVDGDETYEVAAKRELFEEVGLQATSLRLLFEGRKENLCRREGGTWHYWKLYEAEVTGELVPCKDETKHVGWYAKEDLVRFAKRTEKYIAGDISEQEWEQDPGLELVMYEWFREMGLCKFASF